MKKTLTLLLAFLSLSMAYGANMLTSAEVNVTRLSTTRPVTISLSTAARKSLATLSNSGATVKMQWYSQNGESGTPSAMTGQTSYQLSVTPSNSAVFSKRFFVRVSITSGGTTKSENSELARLVSNTSITQQPTDQEYIIGTNKPVVFTASASTCVDRTRRWYKNGVEIADDAAGFSGQSTDSLVIDVTTSGVKDGDRFSMRANSPYGKTAYAESDKAYLSIRNDYSLGFYVCGTEVMASMADDIRPQDNSLKSGKIYFANNTLYLDNIFVDTSEDFLYLDEGNDVGDIKVLGTDSIRCEKLIVYDHDMVGASTLGGPGKLSVVAYDYLIDGRSGATHVFEDANLSISCYSFVNRCNLIIIHSNISAHNAYFALDSKEDTSLKLQKCAITTPGVTFNSNSSVLSFQVNGEETGEYVIEAHYGVRVTDQWVTDKNKDDVLGDGKVKFNEETNTLVLTNANIVDPYYNSGINIEEDNITIQLNGINQITSTNNSAIRIDKSEGTKIVGPGSATLTGGSLGIYTIESDITIQECYLTIRGGNYGIAGDKGYSSERLTIDNARVYVASTSINTICDISEMTLKNCKFNNEITAFYPSLKGVSSDNGSTVSKGNIIINPSAGGYPVDIMGMTLYSFNAADPMGDGSVSYDSSSKTLTLNKANLTYSNSVIGVWDDINIVVKDTNTIVCTGNYNCLYVDDGYTTHINSEQNSVLNMTSAGDAAMWVDDLYITGGTLNITGDPSAINCASGKLHVECSKLTATATRTTGRALASVSGVYLTKERLVTTGISFNTSKSTYTDAEGNAAKQVVFGPLYGISVSGIAVTDENMNDVLGDGTIRYDDVTNTLILTNANIQATDVDDCILVSDNNVTIQLIGINNITSNNHAGIKFEHCTGGKIVGPGCATIKAATIGLYAYDSDITIKECALFVSATNYGMCGYDAKSSENVTIDNAFVSLTGTDFFSCGDLNSLTLNNAKFTVSGIAFYPSLHGVSTDGGSSVTKNTVSIAPSAGGYPITVKGFVLYNFNAADPLGDGTVSYDAATNTLTLNNANITYDWDAIAVYDDIRIEVIGKNNISSDNYNAINVDDVYDTYIVGDENAVLNLNADRGDGFYGGELHISGGCTVNAVGEMHGLALTGEDLYIDNSSLTATSTSMDANEHAISGMKSEPILSNVYLATEGIHYDATKKAYVDADGKYAKTVSFKSIEDYKIEVADIEVTNLNANDVLGDGKVTYDSATRTLTLNNASISEGSISYGIHIQTDNITIKLIGNNIIGNQTASEGLYIVGSKGTKIVGPGKATFVGYSLGIYIQNSDLTISDCEIIAKALQYGIAGDYNDGETLTISNAKVTAELTGTESDKIGTIMDLKDFVLNGVSILSPSGAVYNATTGDIEVDGAVTKETVVIGKETPVYTLTINAGENGSVNTAVNGTYEEGTSVELIATANSGYKFEKWSDGNTENPRTLVMDKDYTLTASFVEESVIIVKYTINADANDAAMGSVSGAGEYVENSDVTLVATANTGYEFINWTKEGTEVSTSATYTFKATENVTLVANFKAVVTYTIAASANDATMGTVSGAGDYKENSDVTLVATANTGYVFVNWTKEGAEVSTSATYTFKATENVTLVANFKAADPNKYTVALTINDPVMGTATGAGEYDKNASVTLKAIANTGYEFVNWTKDGSEVSTDAEYTFTITENVTLQANFKALPILTNPVTLTVYSIGEGTVNGAVIFTTTVEKGTTITLTATPNTGKELLHWNTKDYGDTETTIDVEMDRDITIAAIFGSDDDSYRLTARADDDEEEYGKVSIQLCVDEMNDTYVKAISGMYPKDTRFKIQAIAEDGYEFVCWNKDIDDEPNTNATRNIVLTKKTSLYAHFKKSTDLDEVMNAEGDNTMYDILGRRVDADYRGIVIINGKKTLVR